MYELNKPPEVIEIKDYKKAIYECKGKSFVRIKKNIIASLCVWETAHLINKLVLLG